ncbi:MAG TPA: hydrogenase expression/formation protein HypE [Candidatus Dormibacteraeota bacterium]|nr:hydrogenase expression/formation protein HypE [Candidatus Dormibacteraeota bacterium]
MSSSTVERIESERNGSLGAGPSCPVPITEHKQIVLGHGSGGRLTHRLIQQEILPQFRNAHLEPLHDGAILDLNGVELAFTADSYVVKPLFFPGGDIGTLAINGTVNDLAMCGARPMYLSAGFILEEGLQMAEFRRIVASMRTAAKQAGVELVTGDTKVVDRGKGDQIFINTSGVGLVHPKADIRASRVQPGDHIVINGPIAAHGIAIMSVREGLEFEAEIQSDTAPLNHLVETLFDAGHTIHMLRDPTRGGLASSLNEIAEQAKVCIQLDESSIPIAEEIKAACEMLGFDPLYVANEGKFLAIVPADQSEAVLETMSKHPLGREGAIIAEVLSGTPHLVTMKTRIGGTRVVDMLSGEQLPRIC